MAISKIIVFFIFVSSLFVSSSSQNCSNYTFRDNKTYAACETLPVLNSFLHWNYYESNHSVDIAYRHTSLTASNWAAWSLNPSGGAMIGAQCLVAFRNTSGLMSAYTSPITSYRTRLEEGPLSFEVPRVAAEFDGDQITIYATIKLPNGTTAFTHVWQHGVLFGDTPGMHPSGDNLNSIGIVDFASGITLDNNARPTTTVAARLSRKNRMKFVHGVLNVVSWGILVPIGAMLARYLRIFEIANPMWFYLHVACQLSGYVVGVAGWATGIKLGSESPGIVHTTHRNIGITIFALATLQVLSLKFRPKPNHKYRSYWNYYHKSIGYSVIVLSAVNIFQGFDILDSEKKWKKAYIGVIIFLGAVCVVLEAITQFIVFKRKEQSADNPKVANGINELDNV
ncbi:hypothetical protein ABFS83_08G151900 [Erythranthe nasuta]